MFVGARDPHDTVELAGTPDFTLTIPGGTHGDLATAAVVVNSLPLSWTHLRVCAPRAISPCASSRPAQSLRIACDFLKKLNSYFGMNHLEIAVSRDQFRVPILGQRSGETIGIGKIVFRVQRGCGFC